jgi:hypothetical protein
VSRATGVQHAVLALLPLLVPGRSLTDSLTHTSAADMRHCRVPPSPLQVPGKEASRCVSRLEALESKLAGHRLWSDPSLLPRLVALQHKESLGAAARAAKKELKAAQVCVHMEAADAACVMHQAVSCLCVQTGPRLCLGMLLADRTVVPAPDPCALHPRHPAPPPSTCRAWCCTRTSRRA